jgi:cysteinyl-tRNA synthetase
LAHYRSQLIFSRESLTAAGNARKNLGERIQKLKAQGPPVPVEAGALSPQAEDYRRRFEAEIGRDLALPQAVALLWNLLKDPALEPDQKLALALDMDRVLGLKLGQEEEGGAAAGEAADQAANQAERTEIEALIQKRAAARQARDFAAADALRGELEARGVLIQDGPEGTTWSKK